LLLACVWITKFGFKLPQSSDYWFLLRRDAWFLVALGLGATAITLISLFMEFKLSSSMTFIGWVFYLPVIFNVLVPMFVMFFSVIGIFYTPWLIFTDITFFNILINGVIRFPDENISGIIQNLGYILIALGLFTYTVGLYQILSHTAKKRTLVTHGLYGIVRHPQYIGIFLWTLGFAIIGLRLINYLMWLTLCYSYILLAEYEEAGLVKEFGQDYIQYRDKVPFIIPYGRIILKPIKNLKPRIGIRIASYTALYIALLFASYYIITPFLIMFR
jgi:protein-S-isoprenylcysteine O-methyltransferase Ste14